MVTIKSQDGVSLHLSTLCLLLLLCRFGGGGRVFIRYNIMYRFAIIYWLAGIVEVAKVPCSVSVSFMCLCVCPHVLSDAVLHRSKA